MWQYGSVQSIPGFNTVDATVDGDVSHGDIEYVKDMMVPAVWWNNSSGDWGTMTNWNSGQPIGSHANGDPAPTAPYTAAGQYPAVSGGVLPVPRLPGTAGSGPAITSGVNDTVILERPSANITVDAIQRHLQHSQAVHARALNITGGIAHDQLRSALQLQCGRHRIPCVGPDFGPVLWRRLDERQRQSLTCPTLQVDASQTFTLGGGTLTFNNDQPGSSDKGLRVAAT